MMRRLTPVLDSTPLRRALVIAMAIVIVGCTSSGATGAPTTSGDAASPSTAASGAAPDDFGAPKDAYPVDRWDPTLPAGAMPDLPRRVGVLNVMGGTTLNGPLMDALNLAAETEDLEVITSDDSKGDAALTTQHAQTFLDRGVVGLFSQLASPAMQPVNEKVMATGAAVLTFNQGPATTPFYAIQYSGGYAVGTRASQHITDTLGGDAQIVWLNLDGNPPLKPRTQGFMDALADAGFADKLVGSISPPGASGTITVADAQKAMSTFLEQHPDVNVVAGASDDFAIGAMAALKAAGKWESTPGLAVFGVDGTQQALDLIKAGDTPFKATAAVNFPMIGYLGGRLFGRWADGLTIPMTVVFPYALIDSPELADQLAADTQTAALPGLYDKMVAGDNTYVLPLGSINYATHNAYFDGPIVEKLPDLNFTP